MRSGAPATSDPPAAPASPEARLARLRADGADHFDPPAYYCVEALLSRARALGGGAAARLEARAAARLDLLEEALRRARADAEGHLRALTVAGGDVDPALRAALRRGDLAAVRRGARRGLRELLAARRKTAVPWLARLRGEAAAREIRLPPEIERGLAELGCDGDLVERHAHHRARALSNALSAALFRESVGTARAALAVARAADNIPEDAGPYNAHALAARALQAVERVSPAYLRALFEGLDDLAALEAALAPEPGKVGKRRVARRGRAR